jgi:hypothetical protein
MPYSEEYIMTFTVEKIGGVTEHTSHTAMSKDTLVFPCRPTYNNLTQVASGDTQGSQCGHPTTKVTIKFFIL